MHFLHANLRLWEFVFPGELNRCEDLSKEVDSKMGLGSWITYWLTGNENLSLVIDRALEVLACYSSTNTKAFTSGELIWDMGVRKCLGGLRGYPQAFERFRGTGY